MSDWLRPEDDLYVSAEDFLPAQSSVAKNASKNGPQNGPKNGPQNVSGQNGASRLVGANAQAEDIILSPAQDVFSIAPVPKITPVIIKEAAAEQWELGLTAFLLAVCCGHVSAFAVKIGNLTEAPPWAFALYLPPLLWAIACAATAPKRTIAAIISALPLALFVFWAALTFLWSNNPELTLKQGILFIGTFVVGLALSARFNWRQLGLIMIYVHCGLTTLSFLFALLIPAWGVMKEIYPGAWSGIYTFKQTFGIQMALGLAVMAGYGLANRQALIWIVPFALLTVVNIIMSKSATGVLVCGLGVAVAFGVFLTGRHITGAILTSSAIIIAVVLVPAVFYLFGDELFKMVGKDPNLTGRTQIWALLDPFIHSRGLLGWGYQAFWTDNSLTSPVNYIEQNMDGFRPPDAHSTPRDIFLQMGLVGIGLAIWITLKGLYEGLKLSVWHQGALIALPWLTIHYSIIFTESLGLYPMDYPSVLLQALLIKMGLTYADMKNEARRQSYQFTPHQHDQDGRDDGMLSYMGQPL